MGKIRMQVQNCYIADNKRSKISFKEGHLNIMATSDNHGRLEALPTMFDKFDSSIKRVFPNKDQKNTVNVFMNSGDWFINAGKTGFISDKSKTAADYQVEFFNLFIDKMKEKVPNLKVFFTPGNHDFDDGDTFILNKLASANLTTVITNANLDSSPAIQSIPEKNKNKFVESSIIEIPDDKNPAKIHKVLVLGITNPSVDFYTPDKVNDLDIIDRSKKKDINIQQNDLLNTFLKMNKLIEDFKLKNPNGAVIAMCHTGSRTSKMIAKNVPDINLILNGHDHLDQQEVVTNPTKGNETLIVSLDQNNEKFSSIKLYFDDEGNLKSINNTNFYPFLNKGTHLENKDNPITLKLNELLKEDLKPFAYISGPTEITKLSTRGIRQKNNFLANFVTDAIAESIKKYEPDTQIVGIPSSSIRQSLPVNGWTNNLKLMNVFSGQSVDLADLYIGTVKGSDLVKCIIENYGDNLKNETRNPIMHYSGLKTNKTEIEKLINAGERVKIQDYTAFIKVKSDKQDPFKVFSSFNISSLNPSMMYISKNYEDNYVPVDLNKSYKIILPKVMFKVPNIETIVNLENKFKPTNHNINNLLTEYFVDNNYKVSANKSLDTRIT